MNFLFLACSGPGAGRAIQSSIREGYVCAALALVMLVAMVWLAKIRKGGKGLVAATVFFTALRPAWTISAILGDCGMSKASSSEAVTLILFALLLVQVTLTVRAKKRARLGGAGMG